MNEWTVKDAKYLQKFLESDTGLKLKNAYRGLEPSLDAENIEGRALQAAEFSAHRKLGNLIRMMQEVIPEPKVKDEYIDMSGLDVNELRQK